MRYKYYQFHYAEKVGVETVGLGILNYKSRETPLKASLVEFTRLYLKNPLAVIGITHTTKLTKSEYQDLTGERKIE